MHEMLCQHFVNGTFWRRRMLGEMTLVWGLPPGDWETWVGSVAVALSFFVIAFSTVVQTIESRCQVYLDESAQARLVGASVEVTAEHHGTRMDVEVINASPLPLRQVCPYVRSAEAHDAFDVIPPNDVLPNRQTSTG
jgi:hypothetical protein